MISFIFEYECNIRSTLNNNSIKNHMWNSSRYQTFESLEVFLIKQRQLLDWHLTIDVSITRFLPLLSDRYSRFQAVCHRLWTQFVNPNR